jgi:hypothetical protein
LYLRSIPEVVLIIKEPIEVTYSYRYKMEGDGYNTHSYGLMIAPEAPEELGLESDRGNLFWAVWDPEDFEYGKAGNNQQHTWEAWVKLAHAIIDRDIQMTIAEEMEARGE